jgi:hypothetical protein
MKSPVIDRIFMSPGVRYVIGPAFLIFGGLPRHLLLKVPLLVAGLAMVAISNRVADLRLREEDARRALRVLLDTTVRSFEAARPASVDQTLRANIMILDPSQSLMRIAFATSGYSAHELQLQWAKGQGCAGRAWESGETRVVPDDVPMPLRVEDSQLSSRPYGMTEEQIRATADLTASVISVPLYIHRDSVEPVGVLNLDDSRAPEESLLTTPDIRGAVEDLASNIAELLQNIPRHSVFR